MKVNAITIANWFVDKYNQDKDNQQNKLTLLRLVKLVYIAHGFMLAVCNRGLLDPRFDKVEAWKYGPVIPSVYLSFRHNGKDAIRKKETVMVGVADNYEAEFEVPELSNSNDKDKEDIEGCLEFVWNRYILCSAGDLVEITHQSGTPWDVCYVPNRNVEIPDYLTKKFYTRVLETVERKKA